MSKAQRFPQFTAEHRNNKVKSVLAHALGPISPSDIARQINEEWCHDGYPSSAAIAPVLKRIGAVGNKGRWTLAGAV